MRLAFNIGIIVSILFLPWWVSVIVMITACLMLNRFYEVIIYGIAIDALYGTQYGFYGLRFAWTLFSVLLFSLSLPIRQRLSW